MKSALYARVSTTHNDQITSFNMQQKYSNANFNILAIYGEQTSGRQLYKRKEQQRLLNDCGIEITFIPQQTRDKDGNIKKLKTKKSLFILTERQPLYECIIVANTSRWGRNIIEVKEMIEALHNKGVVLWFDDLGKFSNATDLSLTLDLLFLLDENYSKQVSEKVNRGLERARKENYLHMHTNFFGMDYIKGENKLVPNGDSQTIINIFNEYKNGASIRTLAAKYNKTQSRVKDILDNPKFAGYNFYGKYIGDGSSRRVPIDQLELIPCFDRITPIISFELWNECQDIKNSRKCGTRGVNNSSYPLSSKIICNDCGTSFFHKSKNKKPNTDLWKCRKAHNEPHLCKMPSISESSIIKYLKSDYGLKAIRNTLEFKINLAKENIHIEDKESLELKIKPLNDSLERLKRLYIMGDISEDEYNSSKVEFKSQLDKLYLMLEDIQNKELNILKLNKLSKDYNKILDTYEQLLTENPQELFNKIEYIKTNKIIDLIKDKSKCNITEVMFKDFSPIKEYYGQFIILDN